MRSFTIYTANVTGSSTNCLYPHAMTVDSEEALITATSKDHVAARYTNNYRSRENFECSDVIPLDCDNDHSENPEDWMTPYKLSQLIPGVGFAATFSKSHNKQKGNKSPRPRFHVFFPVEMICDEEKYTKLKQQIAYEFPFFDANAMDSARFLFGFESDGVIYQGDQTIVDFLENDPFADLDAQTEQIVQGQRNAVMSHIAGRLMKRYGNTEEAHNIFLEQAERCNPPLDEEELDHIWNSAAKFGKKVAGQKGYIPPEVFNSVCVLKPADFTDLGQVEILVREYGRNLRYSTATGFLVYNGSYWEEDDPGAQRLIQELTDRQLEEAQAEKQKATLELVKNGAMDLLVTQGAKKAAPLFNKKQRIAYERFQQADLYEKFVLKRRDSKYISSVFKECRTKITVDSKLLDSLEFLLNTPSRTYDLRRGLSSPLDHSSGHLICKQTAVDPSNEGAEIWQQALNTFFQNDQELIDYVQKIVGLSAIGKVYVEALIIAYGEGRNGKSTFWNVISRTLGSYSGNMSADVLTIGWRRNVKPEMAEARGKRLLIAAELEEGMRLSTSNVKQLCSTDDIYAEKKYKDPFSYTPTHTLVLYTNHLPRVGSLDKGTWRRLIVIPFNAVIDGSSDIKNYADYLYEKAGGAILSWIIEGARKVIACGYRIEPPTKVADAIRNYRESSDWFSAFLEDCCEVDPSYVEKSGQVYDEYRNHSVRRNEHVRNCADFYQALDSAGFERFRNKKGRYIRGLRLKSEFDSE